MAGKQADIKVGVITSYDDKGLKGAKNSLDNFKTAIADADGVGGKMKAGWGSITQSVQANAGALAVGAGAALVAFGVKAVGAFTDTAKAALDLGHATGLSTEDASRWIAVADDMGVSASDLTTGLGKIAKTLDDTKWKTYGIATRDASGEARDANDILLDSLDMLGKITNETERARVGNALFGKGYANLAPLIGKTRGEMEQYLGSVEKGQVITAEEAKKAERFRLAQDQLSDAFKDVTLAIGEQVAALAPLLVKVAQLVALTTGASEDSADYGNELANLAEQYGLTTEQQNAYFESIYTGKTTIEDVRKELEKTGQSLRDQEKSWEVQTDHLDKVAAAASETDRETRRLTKSFEEVKAPVDTASRAMDKFTTSVAEADLAFQGLTGKLDEEEAWENVNTKIAEFNKESKQSPELIRETTRAIGEYVIKTDTIPAQKKTEILVALKEGDIPRAEMLLAALERTRTIYLDLVARGSGDIIAKLGAVGAKASGGPVSRGGNYLVGEQGPELIHMNGNGNVSNARDTAAMLGGGGSHSVTINVNAGLGTNGYDVAKVIVNNLAEYDRRNGTHIVTPAGR